MISTKNDEDFSEKNKKYASVPEFYADQSVFITGGSGFLGKALIEKLLRSCPKIKNIFVLIRGKKGVDAESRGYELTNYPIFDELRKTNPSSFTKIIPIKGDITELKLGLSQEDEDILIKSVSVVIHSAATVRFNEMLKKVVGINLLGTKMVIELCRKMINFKALVHVSTAYSNCDKKIIEEMVYEPPIEINKLINLMDCLSEDTLDRITPKIIGERPNTYTFTKALAENIVADECGRLPVSIVRPSIVISSQKEPIKGWTDNFNGTNGLVVCMGLGYLRSLNTPDVVLDLVPVDKVANLIIVAAWKTAISRSSDIKIYFSSTSEHNPIKIVKFTDLCCKSFQKYPYSGAIGWPNCTIESNKIMFTIKDFIYHKLPLYISKLISTISKKTSNYEKMQERSSIIVKTLHYFLSRDWLFKGENTIELYNELSVDDKDNFDFNVKNIQWDSLLKDYNLGLRQYVLKQNPATIPECRIQINRFYKYQKLFQLFTFILFFMFILYFVRDYKISAGVTVITSLILHCIF